MKSIFEHIDNVKEKPHHIRKQVAFAVAGSTTAAIAFVWFAGNLALGVFNIQGSSIADVREENSVIATDDQEAANVAGVAAALSRRDASAKIQIVDVSASSSVQKSAEQTVIPF